MQMTQMTQGRGVSVQGAFRLLLTVLTVAMAGDTAKLGRQTQQDGIFLQRGVRQISSLWELRMEYKAAVAAEPEAPEPLYSAEKMPKVSTTLRCIIYLLVQYFTLYTGLAIARTVNQFTNGHAAKIEAIFGAASLTVTYAPMLAVLFLGTRMRAIQLTHGQTEKYGLPQGWVQAMMQVCTYAVLAQGWLVLLSPMFLSDHQLEVHEDTGDLIVSCRDLQEAGHTFPRRLVIRMLIGLRYVIMITLYGGFTAVCVGLVAMQAPKELWGDKAPPVSPAVLCTMVLAVTFFVIYLGVLITRMVCEFFPNVEFVSKLNASLTVARYTVNFAPMLAILFIGTRMRYLQLDPKEGNPPVWAQCCFYACSTSVVVQALLCILAPLLDPECQVLFDGEIRFEGAIRYEFSKRDGYAPMADYLIQAFRYILLLGLYGGTCAIMVAVFLAEHEDGPKRTPPVSPAMQCVMLLIIQYFCIYTGLFIGLTINAFMRESRECVEEVVWIFAAGTDTVMFAPMLCVLFIGARMQALQLATAKDGSIPPQAGPQPWVQQAMFLATYSTLLQLLVVMLIPMVTCQPGNPGWFAWFVGICLSVVHYASVVVLWGSACAIVYGICVMIPETLPPYVDHNAGILPGLHVPTPPPLHFFAS